MTDTHHKQNHSTHNSSEIGRSNVAKSLSATIEEPPVRSNSRPATLLEEIGQGLEFVRFAIRISQRIRSGRNRFRFIIGVILWKPFLPEDE